MPYKNEGKVCSESIFFGILKINNGCKKVRR